MTSDEDALKNVQKNFKKLVKEETDKVIYNTVKDIINKEQPSYSQCPGECYSEFWEEETKQPSFDIDELTRGKTYDKDLNEWVEQTTQYRIDYYKEGDLSRRWKYFKTMNSAIAKAYEMVQSEEYTIIGIETEYPNTGQD